MSELRERYASVSAGIPDGVELIAVSKTRPNEAIQEVYDLGHRAFGENRPQELRDKAPALPNDIEWHFIGRLQSNKVKYVVPHATLIHSIDSVRLLDEVNKRASSLNKVQDVLIQVHIAQEEAKTGFSPEELDECIQYSLKEHKHIRIRGLMGMATFTEHEQQIESEFSGLKKRFDGLVEGFQGANCPLDILSMGMSGDASIAMAQGSTMVRIGTAIFGKRF